MAKRTGPFATVFAMLFAVPFLAVGAFGVVHAVKTHDAMVLLFTGVFGGAGVWQIVRALRDRRTPESLTGGAPPPRLATGASSAAVVRGYREAAPRGRTAAEVYAPVLASAPLPKVRTTLGRSLAVALGVPSANDAIAPLVFGGLWTGLTGPFFIATLRSAALGQAAFSLCFVAVGLGIGSIGLRKLLARMKLPVVEIDAEPAYLGDDVHVRVEQRGPAKVLRLQIDLECRETARYTVGTDTRTEEAEVWTASLYDEPMGEIRRGERAVAEGRATLPASLPHSFEARNNAIVWAVRVRADIDAWPDYDERFVLRVVPRVAS